jgi:hypothetical protein
MEGGWATRGRLRSSEILEHGCSMSGEWREKRREYVVGEEEKERVKSKNGGKLKILFWRASNIVKLEGN